MFYAVILKASKTKLVLRENWIKGINDKIDEKYYFGVERGATDYTVFYSKHENSVPNFNNAEISNHFDEDCEKYYVARILYAFGRYHFALYSVL